MMKRLQVLFLSMLLCMQVAAQVNVFLGTSGDHGQLSPAASYPFSMLDIGPQTYPNTHTGYEHKAKIFLGFTHGRLEGVGCQGSGGNLLIKPYLLSPENELIKKTERGSPGYYAVSFKNGIAGRFTLKGKSGIESYHFPAGKHGFYIDLAHALANGFRAEQHIVTGNGISGWIESGTTCRVGTYRIYYALEFDQPVAFSDSTAHTFNIITRSGDVMVRVAFSSVNTAYAKAAITHQNFEQVKQAATLAWNKELSRIKVTGEPKEKALFESLLYRSLQAPFEINEPNGAFRASNGAGLVTMNKAFSGWSVWDNYKTALPLLSIIQPERYQDIVTSIAGLYQSGKKNWATKTEPSNTVRTEHAIVVLLDAYRKGYHVNFQGLRDSLLKETDHLDFSKPDKALESSYDVWAMAEILDILGEDSLSKVYLNKAARWKTYWNKDFKDLSQPDVDQLSARNMYQGTIWQYHWFVPFDQKGLIEQCGGETAYLNQLNQFFDGDFYNAANEPDIQVPYMYQFTGQPWKSQDIIRKYAKDTVIQYYYDDNYRGINPTIDRVYNNRPEGMVNSMDEDMGAMSAWYVLAACGLSPACVGWPVYYLHVPLFKNVGIHNLHIRVNGNGRYIRSVIFNGNPLDRNWLTQNEIVAGGSLVVYASAHPTDFGTHNRWISSLDQTMDDGPYVVYRNGKTVIKSIENHFVDSSAKTVQVHCEGHPEWDFSVPLKKKIETPPCIAPKNNAPLFICSDIEGEFEHFRALLLAGHVIDTHYNWTFGKGKLVLAGDLFDRGKQVSQFLWLLYKLEDEAAANGGEVHVILGNHDIMNLDGDFRYVQPEYFNDAKLMNEPYGALYGKDTELGRWLRSKNVVERIGDLLVMHGGISPEVLSRQQSIASINREMRLFYDVHPNVVPDSLKDLFNANAIHWYRGYFLTPRATTRLIDSTLAFYHANQIIVGHDIIKHISKLYGGKVIGVDVDEHEGTHEALLIENGQYYRIDEKGQKQMIQPLTNQ